MLCPCLDSLGALFGAGGLPLLAHGSFVQTFHRTKPISASPNFRKLSWYPRNFVIAMAHNVRHARHCQHGPCQHYEEEWFLPCATCRIADWHGVVVATIEMMILVTPLISLVASTTLHSASKGATHRLLLNLTWLQFAVSAHLHTRALWTPGMLLQTTNLEPLPLHVRQCDVMD